MNKRPGAKPPPKAGLSEKQKRLLINSALAVRANAAVTEIRDLQVKVSALKAEVTYLRQFINSNQPRRKK